jgi:hypothetical protein
MRLTTYTGTSYRRIRPAKCACPRAAHDTGHAPAQRWPNAVGRTLVKHWSDNSQTGQTLFKTGQTLVRHWSNGSNTGQTPVIRHSAGQRVRGASKRGGSAAAPADRAGQILVKFGSNSTHRSNPGQTPQFWSNSTHWSNPGQTPQFWSNSTHWSNTGQTLVKRWSNPGQTPQGKRSAGPRGRVEAPPPRLRRAGPEFDQYRSSRQPASGPCAALPRVAPTRGVKRGRPPSDPGLARV